MFIFANSQLKRNASYWADLTELLLDLEQALLAVVGLLEQLLPPGDHLLVLLVDGGRLVVSGRHQVVLEGGDVGDALVLKGLQADVESLLLGQQGLDTAQVQVWSLTQFYSLDFSKSRIGVNKCVFYKRTIKVCVSCC